MTCEKHGSKFRSVDIRVNGLETDQNFLNCSVRFAFSELLSKESTRLTIEFPILSKFKTEYSGGWCPGNLGVVLESLSLSIRFSIHP